MSILDDIIQHKRGEVEQRKARTSIESLKETIATLGRPSRSNECLAFPRLGLAALLLTHDQTLVP